MSEQIPPNNQPPADTPKVERTPPNQETRIFYPRIVKRLGHRAGVGSGITTKVYPGGWGKPTERTSKGEVIHVPRGATVLPTSHFARPAKARFNEKPDSSAEQQ